LCAPASGCTTHFIQCGNSGGFSGRRAFPKHGSGECRGEIHSRSAAIENLIEGRNATPETTPFKLRPIVARTFSVALKHMSRAQVVAVDQFAEKYRMSVQSTYLPFDYPQYSSADFRASTMRPLFEYGARCALSGRLWTTLDETMDTVATQASKRSRVMNQEVECPLRDVPFTAGITDE
jgi:hypothetical protein